MPGSISVKECLYLSKYFDYKFNFSTFHFSLSRFEMKAPCTNMCTYVEYETLWNLSNSASLFIKILVFILSDTFANNNSILV